MALFAVVPSVIIVGYSFLRRDFYGQAILEFSLEGWSQSVDSIGRTVLLRTTMLAFGVTFACLVVAYPAALVIAKLPQAGRHYLLALIGFPMAMSALLRTYGWMNLLPSDWRGNLWSVAFVMMANYVPFMLLPLLRSIERIDLALPHAAMDLGATPWQSFWTITFPLSRSGMYSGSALVFIPACGEYLIPHFVGDGKTSLIGTQIIHEFMERRNWPFAASMASCLLLLIALPLAFSLTTRRAAVAE